MSPPDDTSNIDPQKALGNAVRTLRGELDLSQAELAERSDLSPAWIAQVESGTLDPTWGDMRRLAGGLQISLERLSELAEEFEEGSAL